MAHSFEGQFTLQTRNPKQITRVLLKTLQWEWELRLSLDTTSAHILKFYRGIIGQLQVNLHSHDSR